MESDDLFGALDDGGHTLQAACKVLRRDLDEIKLNLEIEKISRQKLQIRRMKTRSALRSVTTSLSDDSIEQNEKELCERLIRLKKRERHIQRRLFESTMEMRDLRVTLSGLQRSMAFFAVLQGDAPKPE